MTINYCYQCLELPPTASFAQVRQAYKKLVKAWHPDRFEADSSMKAYAEERIKIINAAYDHLRRHLSVNATKTQPRADNADGRTCSSRPTAGPHRDILQSIVRLTAWIVSFTADMAAAWQSILYSPRAACVHQRRNCKPSTTTRKQPNTAQPFQFNKEKPKTRAAAGLNDTRSRRRAVYSKRAGYGPRSGKGFGTVCGIAAVERSPSVNAIAGITPIRRGD